MKARNAMVLGLGLTCLVACAGTTGPAAPAASPAAQTSALVATSAVVTTSAVVATSTAPLAPVAGSVSTRLPLTSTRATTPSAGSTPNCTQAELQKAVAVGRPAGSNPLTVGATDFKCQDGWAEVGATDRMDKAQFTFVLRWVDGAWQPVADRTQPCENNEIPAQLVDLACHSN